MADILTQSGPPRYREAFIPAQAFLAEHLAAMPEWQEALCAEGEARGLVEAGVARSAADDLLVAAAVLWQQSRSWRADATDLDPGWVVCLHCRRAWWIVTALPLLEPEPQPVVELVRAPFPHPGPDPSGGRLLP